MEENNWIEVSKTLPKKYNVTSFVVEALDVEGNIYQNAYMFLSGENVGKWKNFDKRQFIENEIVAWRESTDQNLPDFLRGTV